jgi:hypothetical protein
MLPPTLDAASGSLTLQWLAPSGTVDGFTVEGRYGSGAYQPLNASLLSSATLTFSFALPATIAEATDCTFRAKALRGAEGSPYSNEVTYHKPIIPAGQPVGVYDWAHAGTALSWSSASTKADGYIVKRAECTNAGSLTGAWVTLQTTPGSPTTCLDTTAKLGTFYLYTVTNTKGSETSAESQASAVVSTQVPAPSQLVAAYDAAHGGVNLTWGSAFTYGDGVLLERAAADANGNAAGAWVALMGPAAGAGAFLDTQVQEAVSYVYRISNIRASVDSAPLPASAAVTVPPGTPSGLSATLNLNQGLPMLGWTANSSRATMVRVERAEADASGLPVKPWVALTVPAGIITTYTDLSAQEFTRYVYRVTNGCGSTWGTASALSSSVTTPLAAPSLVAASFDGASNAVNLTWTANTTKADHVLVERVAADANGLPSTLWSALTSYGSPSGFTDANPSELTSYLYRVTNLAAGVPSAASAPSALIQVPLAPPSYLSAYASGGPTLTVSWSVPYATDRTYLLGRAEADASGSPTSGWTSLTVPSGYQSGFQDNGGTEGKGYVYRMAISLKGYTTPYRQTTSPALVPLNAPNQLKATAKAGGIDLSWVNQSKAATQVIVRRSSGSITTDVATLAPGTTAYSDANLPLGLYTYVAVAKAGTLESPSTSVSATTLNPADALALSSTTLSVLSANDASLLASGSWAFAQQSPFGILSNAGDAWTAYYPDTTPQLSPSLIQVDAAGHPHSCYLIPSTSSPSHSILRHLWHDGTAWQTENLWEGAVANSYGTPNLQFTLDSTGRPQVLMSVGGYYCTVGTMQYVHYAGGAWKIDSLANAANASLTAAAFSLSLDAADQPHLLFLLGANAVDVQPNGSGGWLAGTLSSEPLSTYPSTSLQQVCTDAANGWLFYTTATSSYPYLVSLKARQKVAGIWQAPQTLTSAYLSYGDTPMRNCSSADRSRTVVGFATPSGLKVYHLAGGTWHETLVYSSSQSTMWYRMGLDGANKLHVLVPTPGGTVTYTDFHE